MEEEITLCKDCGCMTHNVCGKCTGEKLKAREEEIIKLIEGIKTMDIPKGKPQVLESLKQLLRDRKEIKEE